MLKRILAALPFLPLVAVFAVWSTLSRLQFRGPAGDVGALILLLPILPILYIVYRLLRGSLTPWSWPVRIAVGINFLLLVWFMWARVAVRAGWQRALSRCLLPWNPHRVKAGG